MKKTLLILGLLALVVSVAPHAHAAFNSAPVESIFSEILGLINNVFVPFIYAIAFVVFLWGVFQYFIAGGADEEKRNEGKNFIMYALIGFAVMASVWGLVNILVDTFGFGSESRPCLPTFSGGCADGAVAPFGPEVLARGDI